MSFQSEMSTDSFFNTFLKIFDYTTEEKQELHSILANAHRSLLGLAQAEGCPKAFMWYQVKEGEFASFRFDIDGVEENGSSRIFNCALKHMDDLDSAYVVLDEEIEVGEILGHDDVVHVGCMVFKKSNNELH